MVKEIVEKAPETPVEAAQKHDSHWDGFTVARTLQAKIELIIGVADNGAPVATFPVQQFSLGWQDPEGKERDLWDRARVMSAEAERQAVKQWKEGKDATS